MIPPLLSTDSLRHLPRSNRPRARLLSVIVLLLLPASTCIALDATNWSQREDFTLTSTGLVKLALPVDALASARPDLADVRLLDSTGHETPYALIRPDRQQTTVVAPLHFSTALNDTTTVLTLETGATAPLVSVTLQAPPGDFIKPVRIETSTNGTDWTTATDAVPLFRQNGAAQLTLALPHHPAAWIRLTVNDRRSPPVAFTSATLLVGEAHPAAAEPVAVNITDRDELPGETVLTLDLGNAHLPLTALTLACTDPLFNRAITVTARELQNGTIIEHPIASGRVYRVALDGLAPAERLTLPLDFLTTTRELTVHITNGDSPPLAITAVHASRKPVWIVFNAPAPGAYTLLTGQPQAASPRYDLPVSPADGLRLLVTPITFAPLTPNPDYHAPDALANVSLEGAAFSPAGWKFRKPVLLSATGMQQLELDADVLAKASPNLTDLRLVRDGHQLPYLVEHTALIRTVPLVLAPVNDSAQPRLSRWQLKLPLATLPLNRLTLTSSTGLFQRHLRLYEKITDDRGNTWKTPLAEADWTHTPGHPLATLTLDLPTPPRTDTLWLETDNGDNPPLALTRAQAWLPVTRLLFKADADTSIALYYGNPQADAPHYDADLVAGRFFSAEKQIATLGAPENLAPQGWTPATFINRRSGALFWGALVFVSALLLVIVIRLLPAAPKAN